VAVNRCSTGVREGSQEGAEHRPSRRSHRSILGSEVEGFLGGLDIAVCLGMVI